MRYEEIQRGYVEYIWVSCKLKQAVHLSTLLKTGPATQHVTSMTCFFSKCLPKNKTKYFALQDTPFPFHDASHAYRHVGLITAPVRSPSRLAEHEC
jgi:hypothetical protein